MRSPDPVAVREELAKDPDLPRLISHDGVLLADLMEAAPRSDHGPAYAAMVISTGIRRRAELAASRMRQAAESKDAGSALRMARQARGELDRCRARWEALPEPMRRELPPSPARRGPADITGRLATVRDEIRGLRHDLGAGTSEQLAGRLASIARQVADVAAASASQRERQAGDRLARSGGRGGWVAGAAGPGRCAVPGRCGAGMAAARTFRPRQPWRAVRGHGCHD